MSAEKAAGGSSLIDVLDRVLDKGIVISAPDQMSVAQGPGIDLTTSEIRVIVVSLETYTEGESPDAA